LSDRWIGVDFIGNTDLFPVDDSRSIHSFGDVMGYVYRMTERIVEHLKQQGTDHDED
jgi:hypothetical protein